MKIRSQVGMVLNLDKCIGCHTCSVTCKNVWTSREGMEYAWFNNVESKPGTGFPTDWENQEKWKGGWIRKINGKLQPRMGNRAMLLGKIFANPHLPGIDDYYEPFDYDYQNLHNAPESKHQPIARPRSLITGQRMDKITSGPNWEEILGGEFEKRAKDQNFENMQKAMYGQLVAEKIADEARDDTPQALDAVWEEEQVKFFADQSCGESEISAHQRRFAGAVAPQYLNISNGGQH